ncbi:hypothetical protein K461DRAFT_273791 [Myriangium duriaei CBS 260.36]|uniref:C2H2-type domain-containing protein n=1 Tax=Myriangium duriaei CBS 260.36 TaxID=1168546 RepID=A0A9P4J9Y9_9PEZI|nr:hypothetical protein K461DRAFT_273791 [Myriangium duriaei CBS 260.36]
MLGATTTTLGGDNNDHAEQSSSTLPPTSYLCTPCQISFENRQDQRIHMKEPWHVENIKRRMASLAPISYDVFNLQADQRRNSRESSVSSRRTNPGDNSDDESMQSASPFQCLFCSQDFPEDDLGLERNIEHMYKAHGMSVPNHEMVIDLQSFLGYLATEVRAWHECLYCGATKPSTATIQNHMRDKRHCLLNLEREPELLDFWETPPLSKEDAGPVPEQEPPIHLSVTEIRFASGRVIESRLARPTVKRATRRRSPVASMRKALALHPENADNSAPTIETPASRQLAGREEMSMIGISEQQRHALVLAEQKAQRSEATARRVREWAYAKGANQQKFDQLNNQMKWGKQNHKLLPR